VTAAFEDVNCSCPHAPDEHDDGFGCTAEGCECVATWIWIQPGSTR
jgi:hypothetical protein